MDKKRIESLVNESEAVREAVKRGVPEHDAVEVYANANHRVELGNWVEIFREEPRLGKSVYHPHSTSIIRYWGPKEFDGVTRSKAELLYEKGIIGKTHELVIGSDRYSKDLSSRPSYPVGRRVVHRHWEIEDMHKYQKKRQGLEDKLIILAFAAFMVFGLLGRSFSGFATADFASDYIAPATIFILVGLIFAAFLCRLFIYNEN